MVLEQGPPSLAGRLTPGLYWLAERGGPGGAKKMPRDALAESEGRGAQSLGIMKRAPTRDRGESQGGKRGPGVPPAPRQGEEGLQITAGL